jgi:hypothetical protein
VVFPRGRNGRNATKSLTKKWDDKTKSILIRITKMRRMNPQALILVFKEITRVVSRFERIF